MSDDKKKQGFIPLVKQSKLSQKKFHDSKRGSWGDTNPVTRKPPNPKAYNRAKRESKSSLLEYDRTSDDLT